MFIFYIWSNNFLIRLIIQVLKYFKAYHEPFWKGGLFHKVLKTF